MRREDVWLDKQNDECEEGGGQLGSNPGIYTREEDDELE